MPTDLSAAELATRINGVSIADAHRLRRRLTKVRALEGAAQRRETAALAEQIARAERRIEQRRSSAPTITYPRELPVAARVDDLAAAIRDHQVVIVAGETGSGKSTQLPKICMQLGRGVRGLIGHTQPRRIAARTLAERIAEETETLVGGAVGYTIRFGDHTGPRTLVKLMTDGILLAEIGSDPDLLAYDTIIVDEAHERSLNIDFLIGYLKRLLPRRPDLKLIITSATIDPEKFSAHFDGAPIVEVSGRTYPVEIRYRPAGLEIDDEDADGYDGSADSGTDTAPPPDLPTAIGRAVDELLPEGDGDILVFLPGERDITDTSQHLQAHLHSRGGLAASIDVLPLYGRLSIADQHRVFTPSGRRRIVLATNVAETSLTVPGIRFVIDPGTARISRYSSRTKVQRLPIEKVSQASAGQRAGRCGRVANGICIRLYSQDDFEERPEFTDPEISRTSLAAVMLQMAALGLGDTADFPFLDPPDPQQIIDGMTVLAELGAIHQASPSRRRRTGTVQLTDMGRAIARLPVDPRLARVLVEADRRRCLAEALVMVAALAIRDVREYPLEDRDKAVAAHSRFTDPTSDFVSILGVWHYLRRRSKELSGNKFRKMCRTEYLHFLRFREWQDLHAQLRAACGSQKMDIDSSVLIDLHHTDGGPPSADPSQDARPPQQPASVRQHKPLRGEQITSGHAADQRDKATNRKGMFAVAVDHRSVHTSLAAGFLSHIGARIDHEKRHAPQRTTGRRPAKEYQGTRGSAFAIWPGSVLAKNGAPFVLAAELVETSRLWARTVAAVDAEWIEEVGGELLRRSYSEPRWSAKKQAPVTTEKTMLLGVTLVAARTVPLDRVDAEQARDLLIRTGLVEGELRLPLPFLQKNAAALAQVVEEEHRQRRGGIAIDDEALFALYDARIPANITTGKRLESWWRKKSRREPDLLVFTPQLLTVPQAAVGGPDQYPDRIAASGVHLDLDYVFQPGSADDGVSATVPLAALATIDPESLPAQVPGLRRDLALALIKSLPKNTRRLLVPAPDFADAALAAIGSEPGGLPKRLAAELSDLAGVPISADDFDYQKVPDHLRMRFTVVDEDGRAVASGEDLAALQRQLLADTRAAVAEASGDWERRGMTSFPDEPLPEQVDTTAHGQPVTAYPALVDEGSSVAVRVYTTPEDQRRAMRRGTVRLIALALEKHIGALPNRVRQWAAPRMPGGRGGSDGVLVPADLLRLSTAPHGSLASLTADAADAAIAALLDWAGGVAWNSADFAARVAKISPQLERAVGDIVAATSQLLDAAAAADAQIAALARAPGNSARVALMQAERDWWLQPGFIARHGAQHLPDITRYLQALQVRAERAATDPGRDDGWSEEIEQIEYEFEQVLAALRPERRGDDDVLGVHRLIAEYRIALFAQPLRTAVPVSAKRVRRALEQLGA